MIKNIFSLTFLIVTVFISMTLAAQKITPADLKRLKAKEDTLSWSARYLITDSLQEDRMVSDSIFIKTLVRALQIKNSFYYPFDSILGISKLYAPDSSFKIFTWNIEFDEFYSRQRGAIQMRTSDGSLKLFPLRDVSEFIGNPEDSIRSPARWIGSIYYNIIATQYNGKKYYTLFGLDYHSVRSQKKWLEVLHFNDKKEPLFGGPFFDYSKDSLPKSPGFRYSMEYKKGARVLLNYVPDLKMILVDHLISETDEPALKHTYIPDGDSEGFVWQGGKWVHLNKVFESKLEDGEAPLEESIYEADGKIIEKIKSEKRSPKKSSKAPKKK